MPLSYEEQCFVVKRAKLMRTWRYVGAILLALILGLGVWLFLSNPLLANPFVVMTRLQSNSIPESTMVLMAGMLPVVALMCIVLAVTAILFVFAAFSNEKKYLTIIQRESREIGIAQSGKGGSLACPPHTT